MMAMLKAFKMPLFNKGNKGVLRREAKRDGADQCRAMVQSFKAMLRKAHPVDVNAFDSTELSELQRDGLLTKKQVQEMEALREGYTRNGPALWDYARAVIKELPKAERHAEMQEIRKLLARVGFREEDMRQN
jgi:hypothetical protein